MDGRNCLPEGLPASLVDGDDEFERLCVLVGLEALGAKQTFLESPAVRAVLEDVSLSRYLETNSASESHLQIAAFYRSPSARLEVWRSVHGGSSQEEFPRSLEAQALEDYESGVLARDVDEGALGACEGLFDAAKKEDVWRHPALVALPSLRRDLSNWAQLEPDRRLVVVLASFATATILEDVRLLNWAIECVPALAGEYSFLAGDELPSSEAILRIAGVALATAAHSLIEATVPTAAMFDEVARTSLSVEELREPVLRAHETAEREMLVKKALNHIGANSALVRELGDGLGRLRALWESTYLDQCETDIATLQNDCARIEANLAKPLAVWTEQVADVKRIEQDFDPTRESRAKQQWSRAYTEAQDRQSQLWQAVETVLAPDGHSFVAHDDSLQDARDDTGGTRREGQSGEPSVVASAQEGLQLAESQSDTQLPRLAVEPQSSPQRDLSLRPPEVEGARGSVAEGELFSSVQPHSEIASGQQELPTVKDVTAATAEVASTGDQADAAEHVHVKSQLHPVWLALEDKRVGIAYHIARLEPSLDDQSVPTDNLLASLALADHIGSSDGPLIERYTRSLAAVSDRWRYDKKPDDALDLILFAATIQPALFAPSAGALPALQLLKLSPALVPVADIAEKISEHCQRLQTIRLDEQSIPLILDSAELRRGIGEVKDAIRDWAQEQAPLQHFRFVPVARIWQLWLRSGLISEIVRVAGLSAPSKEDLHRVREFIQRYDDNRAFAADVHEANKKVSRSHAGDIDTAAINRLRRPLEPLMTLVANWADLMDMHMARRPDYIQRTLGALASDLRTAVADWRKNTREYVGQAPLHVRIALSYAEDAINRLWGIFDQRQQVNARLADTAPDLILSRDLLLIPDLAVSMNHGIEDESVALPYLLRHREVCLKTLGSAFEARLDRGDIGGAHLITEWMLAESDEALERSDKALKQAIDKERSQAEDTRMRLVGDVEHAYARGQIDSKDRDHLAALAAGRPRESLHSLLGALGDYRYVSAELKSAHEISIADLDQELMSHMQDLRDGERAILEAAINTGDKVLARELRDKINGGEVILSHDSEIDYLSMFLASAPKIESSFLGNQAKPTVDQIDQAAKAGGKLAGISLDVGVHKDILPSQLLGPWYILARQKSAQPEPLKLVLEALGFVDVQVRPGGTTVATVTARPLVDRSLCPLHQYGSTADGKYEVLLNWGPVQNSLIQSIPDTHRHVIVLHFGHLVKDRDWLRQWSLDSRQRLIVLDETLVLFLSTVTSGRLRAFFDCALPFTCIDPFVTTASLVPPELFYGRASERKEIMDEFGSCFVYGGRQIGKTALLRSAEAAFHRPKEAHIARWIDLKANEIGLAREPDAIWDVLWHELGEAGVIPDGERRPSGRQGLLDRVRSTIIKWIEEGNDRRILLLLDEADAFLETDALSDFRESAQLKGIMDSTDRAFKVVLSGLHNVLRTTARANHPLAHFGDPICVGPLLSNGEWKAAQDLVRQPLSAIGCRFQDSAPIFHILARTNYYPSLIQLLGAELARYIRDRRARFPYDIDVDDIGNVFRSGTVQEAIRQRFQLTLQLDSRYEVIAYSIALEFGTDDRAHASGLDRKHIFDLAMYWWRAGFIALGTNDPIQIMNFDALLQEMVGLGVLRRVEGKSNHYTLRNVNILPLLGTTEEVEETLLKERQVPTRFDPATFRARYKHDGTRRGMLTFEQERNLRQSSGVSIIAGNVAAGVDDLPAFLIDRFEDAFREIPKEVADPSALEQYLTSQRPERYRGVRVCLVPADSSWSIPWVKRALATLRRIQRGALIRVVFIATPTTLWRTIEDLENEDGLYEQLDWVNIQPWDRIFLERWCDDLSLGVNPTDIDALFEKTGGWAVVLESFDHSLEKAWRDRFQDLGALVAKERDKWLVDLGIKDDDVERQMQVILDYEGYSMDEEIWDLERIARDEGTAKFSETVLRRRVRWARQLGLLRPAGDKIILNPIVKRVLGPS